MGLWVQHLLLPACVSSQNVIPSDYEEWTPERNGGLGRFGRFGTIAYSTRYNSLVIGEMNGIQDLMCNHGLPCWGTSI